jgi:two-component system, chemotaxis family, chemotaxis protein CheY
MKTLIVEDDATSRLLLVQLLSEYGPVCAVDGGAAALASADTALKQQAPFDLICLDIMLPDMDGHEILRKLRQAEERVGYLVGQGTKIVMTTALRDKDNVMSAFRAACDGYLPKPIDKTRLRQQLRELGLIN